MDDDAFVNNVSLRKLGKLFPGTTEVVEEFLEKKVIGDTELSYVGRAVIKVLIRDHKIHYTKLWNLSSGSVVGKLQATPRNVFRLADNAVKKEAGDDYRDTNIKFKTLPQLHDHWFPDEIYNMICRTEQWCDIMTLAPPDGIFLSRMQDAIEFLAEKSRSRGGLFSKLTLRIMFGNIVGMPVNCHSLIKELTKNVAFDAVHNIRIWVGAWRKGLSWNHAKIIAVDGMFLHTGGHNMWHPHYLEHNPVHDLSIELRGRIAVDAHLYANQQWVFLEKNYLSNIGCIRGCKVPEFLAVKTLVTHSHFPPPKFIVSAPKLPPMYVDKIRELRKNTRERMHTWKTHIQSQSFRNQGDAFFDDGHSASSAFMEMIRIHRPQREQQMNTSGRRRKRPSDSESGSIQQSSLQRPEQQPEQRQQLVMTSNSSIDGVDRHDEGTAIGPVVPMISMGRNGCILRNNRRPSDDGITAMLDSAKRIIRLMQQDLGPVCIPGTKIQLPGCVWPKQYLYALGRVIWKRNVRVEMILSNPLSIPGGLTPVDANYGNGWSCSDVANEIVKAILKQFFVPSPKEPEDHRLSANHDPFVYTQIPTPEMYEKLKDKILNNIRICFVKNTKYGANNTTWDNDGSNTIGLHSKHMIIDDVCCYIGSQNLYISDLAEWGVIIDNPVQTIKIKNEYWMPMWKASYIPTDNNMTGSNQDCDMRQIVDYMNIYKTNKVDKGISSNNLTTRSTEVATTPTTRNNVNYHMTQDANFHDSYMGSSAHNSKDSTLYCIDEASDSKTDAYASTSNLSSNPLDYDEEMDDSFHTCIDYFDEEDIMNESFRDAFRIAMAKAPKPKRGSKLYYENEISAML